LTGKSPTGEDIQSGRCPHSYRTIGTGTQPNNGSFVKTQDALNKDSQISAMRGIRNPEATFG